MINKKIIHNECYKQKNHKIQWIGLILTDAAAKQIVQLSNQDPDMIGLKIILKKSGCAGLTYHMEKVFLTNKKNLIYEHNGAKLFVSLDIMPLIDGTVLDYVQEGLNHMFKFNNPQAQNLCGCGLSFNI